MQSRRGMLTHGAAVCLPGTDLQWSLAKSRWLTRLSLPLSGSHPAKAQAGPILHLVILFSLQARWQTLLLVIGSNKSKGDLEHGTGVRLTMLTTVASYWEVFFTFYFCLFLYFYGFSVLETGSHCVTHTGMELTQVCLNFPSARTTGKHLHPSQLYFLFLVGGKPNYWVEGWRQECADRGRAGDILQRETQLLLVLSVYWGHQLKPLLLWGHSS